MKPLWKVKYIYTCADTYTFIHIHIHTHTHIGGGGRGGREAILTYKSFDMLEKGAKVKPNHLTTASFRSVPQENWS